MLTLLKNPLGHKLTTSAVAGSVTDSSGEALVTTSFSHALTTGDYIYIQSDLESLNGYKYVDSLSYNTFKLRDSEEGPYVQYYQDVDIEYQVSVLQHGVIAVHNPIVYELQSDLYPNNVEEEAYTPNTVVSQENEEGYTRLHLSAALRDPTELAWVELVGTGSLAGVYQIVTVYQDWDVVINLAYSASNNFTGYELVKYYNNYAVNIRVFAGIESGHPWYDERPIRQLATLKFVPDSEGKVKFSISDILRNDIKVRNNLNLDTLPNNIDFWTSFYIDYFETYDSSDGTEITTETGAITEDTLVGLAINAAMPFKGIPVTHMSDYIDEDVYLAKWLTLQDTPVAIVGRFFDLSFILNRESASNPGFTPATFPSLASFNWFEITNPLEPSINWTLTGTGIDFDYASGVSAGGRSGSIGPFPYPMEVGQTYSYEYSVTINQDSVTLDTVFARFRVMDVTGFVLDSYDTGTAFLSGGATLTDTVTFVCPPTATQIGITIHFPIGTSDAGTGAFDFWNDLTEAIPPSTGPVEVTIKKNGVEFLSLLEGKGVIRVPLEFTEAETACIQAYIGADPITEQICVEVLEECDDSVIPTLDDIRLTEDGDFRILE